MKSLKHTIFSVYMLAALGLSAQVPQQINYQAVARNAVGLVLANQSVSVRFTIHDATPTGAIDYQEVQTGLSTNQFGLFTCAIGAGAPVGSYTFPAIVWGTNAKYLQVELDPSGGTNYVDMGTTQLNAVPYALYAASSPAGTAGWGLTGNTGTRYGTDFIGTKDTINLMFRIYDSIAGRIEPGNASLGYLALDNNTTGSVYAREDTHACGGNAGETSDV